MSRALPETQAPARVPVGRTTLGRAGGSAFETVTWADGSLAIGAETPLGRLRFRLALDGALRPRPLLELPPLDPDRATLGGIASGLCEVLDGPDGGEGLARLMADAARREAARSGPGPRAESLRLLHADLSSWLVIPADARQPLAPFLARSGSGPVPEPADAAAAARAAEEAVEAMMAGTPRPRTCPADPCLAGLTAAVERARALGVRSTRHVAVGHDPSEAVRAVGVPGCVAFEALEAEIAARRVTAADLLVVTCGTPGDASLARLLRALSRANAAPRMVVYDAEEILVGTAPALSRVLGIPVAA